MADASLAITANPQKFSCSFTMIHNNNSVTTDSVKTEKLRLETVLFIFLALTTLCLTYKNYQLATSNNQMEAFIAHAAALNHTQSSANAVSTQVQTTASSAQPGEGFPIPMGEILNVFGQIAQAASQGMVQTSSSYQQALRVPSQEELSMIQNGASMIDDLEEGQGLYDKKGFLLGVKKDGKFIPTNESDIKPPVTVINNYSVK